ncbi:DUF1620-domain-containing protein [Calocera cornea HHB12733]|uniref:ER membrane protein complex subunit 1 n=1 Tax=Calocera cornea HHB12733 TaxID=1353952 RepID=A0A165GK11_9BASI|nr:DUF1620-domain-containing protein [Calocera cornea HHB12733]
MLPSIPLLLLSLLPVSLALPSYSPIWHRPLLGPPQTPSQIHRVPGENKTVILAGNRKVVGGLNPGDGEIVWRQMHEEADPVLRHASSGRLTATLSGPSGSTLRLYTPHTGELVLEVLLHLPEEGTLFTPGEVGTGLQFVGEDLMVLSGGNAVRKIGAGGVEWVWTPENADESYLKLYATPSHVHLLGIDPSSKHTHTVLSLSTGELLSSSPLAFPHSSKAEPLMLHPSVALEVQDGKLLSVSLALHGKHKVHTLPGHWASLEDVGLAPQGYVIALKEDGAAHVLRATPDGAMESVWEFSESKKAAHYTESVFAGALDKTGAPHVARVYWTHSLNLGNKLRKGSFNLWSAGGVGGQGMVTGFTFPFQTKVHGTMKDIALEVGLSSSTPVKPIPRFLLHTSTGSLQLWQDDKLQWTRDEGLGDLVGGVAWADHEEQPIALPGSLAAAIGDTASPMGDRGVGDAPEPLVAKWERQLASAWRLPGYVLSFLLRFVESVVPSEGSAQLSHALHKLVLVAGSTGKIWALDTSRKGGVVWDRILGISGAEENMGKVDVQKVLSVGGVGWVVIGHRNDKDGIHTAAWEIVPSTGAIYPPPGREGTTNGLTLFSGRLLDAFILPSDGTSQNETVVLISQDKGIYIFPDDAGRVASLSHRAKQVYFSLPLSLPDVTFERATLEGFAIIPQHESFVALQTFATHLTPSPKSELLQLIRPHRGPVASLGRVMGNKKTLYKYLNPHLVVALTEHLSATDGGEWCGVHVVDEVSGAVVYEASVRKPSGRECGISAVLADNWLVWHFWNDGNSGAVVANGGGMRTKGWRVVVVELYEGDADEVTRSAELSSMSVNSTRVHAISQTYGFPSAWKAVTTTSTKYGITLKDIVVANDRSQIQAYPHAILDPRRPVGKLTSEQKEELLIPFDSVIPDDPRRTVSQNIQVMGTTRLSTTPTALESTTLLLASGVDLFLARLSPSSTFDILSDSFNKTQLILTIIGLIAGIAIVRPIVESKKVRQRWYSTT